MAGKISIRKSKTRKPFVLVAGAPGPLVATPVAAGQ